MLRMIQERERKKKMIEDVTEKENIAGKEVPCSYVDVVQGKC